MSLNTDEEINLIIGDCALCHSTIYGDDSGYLYYKGAMFCTVSCAEEATGDKIKTVNDHFAE